MSDLSLKLDQALFVGAPAEIKLASAAAGMISGYASTFGGPPDLFGDVITAGAFSKSLARHGADKSTPAMLWAHDPGEVIGRWTALREDGKGLFVEGQLNLETQRGREALALLKQDTAAGLSIGYRVPPGGRTFDKDGVRILSEVELLEVTLTAIPANRRARITGLKSVTTARSYEQFLQDSGFAKAAAKRLAAGGWPALAKNTGAGAVAALTRRVNRATANLQRIR